MRQRVIIVRADNVVSVDGETQRVDCSALPDYFHAIQWYGGASPPYGEIEYAGDAQGRRMPNTRFSDIGPYQHLLDAWAAEKARVEAARQQQRAEQERLSAENGPQRSPQELIDAWKAEQARKAEGGEA